MAIYRLYKDNWDSFLTPKANFTAQDDLTLAKNGSSPDKGKRRADEEDAPSLYLQASDLALHVDMSSPSFPPSRSAKARSLSPPPRSKIPQAAHTRVTAPASTRAKKARANASRQIEGTAKRPKISSGLSVVVRRKGGVKEVRGRGKGAAAGGRVVGKARSGGAAGPAKKNKSPTSGGEGWWSTLGS